MQNTFDARLERAQKDMTKKYGLSDSAGWIIGQLAIVMIREGARSARFSKEGHLVGNGTDSGGTRAYLAACDWVDSCSELSIPAFMEAASVVAGDVLPERNRPRISQDGVEHPADLLPEPVVRIKPTREERDRIFAMWALERINIRKSF